MHVMSTNYYLQKILTEEEREKIAEAAKRCRLHSDLIREIDEITGNESIGNCGDTTQRIHIGKRVAGRFIFAKSLEDHMDIRHDFIGNLTQFARHKYVVLDEYGDIAYDDIPSFLTDEVKGTEGRYDAMYEELIGDYCFTQYKTWFR